MGEPTGIPTVRIFVFREGTDELQFVVDLSSFNFSRNSVNDKLKFVGQSRSNKLAGIRLGLNLIKIKTHHATGI